MSPGFAIMENIWQIFKMNLRRKKIKRCQSFVFGDKAGMRVLTTGITVGRKIIHPPSTALLFLSFLVY